MLVCVGPEEGGTGGKFAASLDFKGHVVGDCIMVSPDAESTGVGIERRMGFG